MHAGPAEVATGTHERHWGGDGYTWHLAKYGDGYTIRGESVPVKTKYEKASVPITSQP